MQQPWHVEEREVTVHAAGTVLPGVLTVPEEPKGIVVFAHGSGSTRNSPHNRFVARGMRNAGMATLLFDLLTEEEETEDRDTAQLRFDIPLLARRLVGALDWLEGLPETGALPVGLFGASTGAAAALVAAARRPDMVRAVVSRGGRADLAGPDLQRVAAPSLFIVGEEDLPVMMECRNAMEWLGAPCELAVVAGATHLFEEPGALEEVERLAAAWFRSYLGGRRPAGIAHARGA